MVYSSFEIKYYLILKHPSECSTSGRSLGKEKSQVQAFKRIKNIDETAPD